MIFSNNTSSLFGYASSNPLSMHYSYTIGSMPAIQSVAVSFKRKRSYDDMNETNSIFTKQEQRKRKKRISGTIKTSTRPQVASTFPTPMEIDDDIASNHQSCLPVPMDVDDDTIAAVTPKESSLPVPMDIDDVFPRLTVEESCFPVPMDIDDDIAPVTAEVSSSPFPVPMEIEYLWF